MERKLNRRSWRAVVGWLGIGCVLAGVLGYGVISLVTAERLTRPSNRPERMDARRLDPDARPWSTRTQDGITLRGWYLKAPQQQQHLVVLVHGMWSTWLEMAALGRDLHRHGFDVLLFDLRGHGSSDPSRLSMGRRERGDLRAIQTWARAQGYRDDCVGWLGFSMGGSTILMEAARNPAIQVAVVDSAYGDLPKLLSEQLSRHSGLPGWFNPGILLAARLVFGVRTDDLVPIRFARFWGDRPLLLIHGEEDSLVPKRQALLLAQAAGTSCSTRLLPGVEHAQAYRSNPGAYVNLVAGFFDAHLGH